VNKCHSDIAKIETYKPCSSSPITFAKKYDPVRINIFYFLFFFLSYFVVILFCFLYNYA